MNDASYLVSRIAPRVLQAYGLLHDEEEATARGRRNLTHRLDSQRRARRVSGEAWGFPALFHGRDFSFDCSAYPTLGPRVALKRQRATHHPKSEGLASKRTQSRRRRTARLRNCSTSPIPSRSRSTVSLTRELPRKELLFVSMVSQPVGRVARQTHQ